MTKVLKKYYLIQIEPHPESPGRQRFSLTPSFHLKHPKSGTMDWHIHLVWYSSYPGSFPGWGFDHLTIVSDLAILTEMPDFLSQVATIQLNTQPQEVEQLLLRLGFQRN